MEPEENIIILTDDNDQDTPYEILDELTIAGVRYAVLASLADDDADDADDVLIFRIEPDGDGEAFLPEEDPALLQRVLDAFIVDQEGDSYTEADFVPAE